MGKHKFSFSTGGPTRVIVDTGFLGRTAIVYLDDVPIGEIANDKEFVLGKRYALPDQTTLKIKKVKQGKDKGIQAWHEGQLLAGSAGSAQKLIEQGSNAAFFVTAVSSIAGVLALGGNQLLQNLGFGAFTLAVGIVFGVLAVLMRWKHSFGAAVTAATLYGIEILSSFVIALSVGANPLSGIVIRGFIMYALVRAAMAAGEVRDQRVASVDHQLGAKVAAQTQELQHQQFPPQPPRLPNQQFHAQPPPPRASATQHVAAAAPVTAQSFAPTPPEASQPPTPW